MTPLMNQEHGDVEASMTKSGCPLFVSRCEGTALDIVKVSSRSSLEGMEQLYQARMDDTCTAMPRSISMPQI